MKASFSLALVALVSTFALSAKAATPQEMVARAEKAYSERDYNNAGIQKAQEAADLYAQAAAATSDATVKAQDLVGESEAIYFVGDANQGNDVKIAKHMQGIQAADAALAIFGITDVTNVSSSQIAQLKHNPQLAIVGEALYERGVNLGQWGQANGVMKSLSKWPELKANMQLIVNLGLAKIHQYGAYRVLGRGYYEIPSILGGSTTKAMQYLGAAVKGSRAPGETYSVNGYNTTYYAEALNSNGQSAAAKKMLQDFIKADPAALLPGSEPETRRSQGDAQDLLKSW